MYPQKMAHPVSQSIGVIPPRLEYCHEILKLKNPIKIPIFSCCACPKSFKGN